MSKNRLFTLLLVFVVIVNCSKTIDRTMVIGRYIANHKKAIDTLELRSDGTYTHYYKTPTGGEFTNSNHWEFEYKDGKPTITFSRFLFRLPGFDFSQEPGFWVVQVEKPIWGNLRLCIHPDLNYYSIKQK